MNNNGMGRKEMISLIIDLSGCSDHTQAENHFDYLIRKKLLPDLKKYGRVATAQKTTTKRSCITVEQQLRWHMNIDFCWEEQKRLNLPSALFASSKKYFMMNLDESCIMCSEGNIKVIASANKKKVEKNMDDNRDSITLLRTGSAAGTTGPWIFLVRGECEKIESSALKNLDKKGCPPGSKVYTAPSAYMTDATWKRLAPQLCKGIRKMETVKDHPDWWVTLTLDGFGSHLEEEALQVFAAHNILVVKEEGDTSHINQAYDQSVAKTDKLKIRDIIDSVRSHRKGKLLHQFDLVACCIAGLKKVPGDAWEKSFIKVNLHPDHRVNFDEWVKRIDTTLVTGEKFFVGRRSLYDAMPAAWKHLSPEQRQTVKFMIDRFYHDSKEKDGAAPWCKDNIRELVQIVPFDQIKQIRASYLALQNDPRVLHLTEDAPDSASNSDLINLVQRDLDMFSGFSWQPRELFEKYVEDKTNEEQQQKVFSHLSNHVACIHGQNSDYFSPLTPSAHLNVEVSRDQMRLLNPTPKEVMMGTIMESTVGEKAKKKIAKRKLYFINGNVNSYSRVLNNPKQLDMIKEYCDLGATLAEISTERSEKRKENALKRTVEEKSRAAKKAANEVSEQAKREELLPGLQADYAKGLDSILKLKNERLRELVKYFFEKQVQGLRTMVRADLILVVQECHSAMNGHANVALHESEVDA